MRKENKEKLSLQSSILTKLDSCPKKQNTVTPKDYGAVATTSQKINSNISNKSQDRY